MRNFVLRKRIFSKEITKKRMKMNKIVMLAMAVMALVSCSGRPSDLHMARVKVR